METGEFSFLRKLLPRLPSGALLVVGPGHDCACVRAGGRKWLLTTDSLVEGTHFLPEWISPFSLGWRAFAVNASDIAAMGGTPRFVLVNLAVPARESSRRLSQIERGIVVAARAEGAVVVGGNLTRASELAVTLTVVGVAPRRLVTRAGAKSGEEIYVSGTLGDAALAVARLKARRSVPGSLVSRWRRPPSRVAVGRRLVQSGLASAMIDVSDGLLQDLTHLCRASGVGAIVKADWLPLSRAYGRLSGGSLEWALGGGEDYELLFTVPREKAGVVRRVGERLGCPLTKIGYLVEKPGVRVLAAGGKRLSIPRLGFDHFRTN